MDAKQFFDFCKSKNACDPGLEWITGKSLDEFWKTSERGDWMLWLVNRLEHKITDKQLRLIAIKCARQVQHLMADPRSIDALDVAERFANGEATEEELSAADAAADDAADAAYAAYATYVGDAAARAAADAAYAAARAAAYAAYATYVGGGAAAHAARAADAAAADRAAQADIIREFIPTFPIIKTEIA